MEKVMKTLTEKVAKMRMTPKVRKYIIIICCFIIVVCAAVLIHYSGILNSPPKPSGKLAEVKVGQIYLDPNTQYLYEILAINGEYALTLYKVPNEREWISGFSSHLSSFNSMKLVKDVNGPLMGGIKIEKHFFSLEKEDANQ